MTAAIARKILGLDDIFAGMHIDDIVSSEKVGDPTVDRAMDAMATLLQLRLRGHDINASSEDFLEAQSRAAKEDAAALFESPNYAILRCESFLPAVTADDIIEHPSYASSDAEISDPETRAFIRLVTDYAFAKRAYLGKPIPTSHDDYVEVRKAVHETLANWIRNRLVKFESPQKFGAMALLQIIEDIIFENNETPTDQLHEFVAHTRAFYEIDPNPAYRTQLFEHFDDAIAQAEENGDESGLLDTIEENEYDHIDIIGLAITLHAIRTRYRPHSIPDQTKAAVEDAIAFMCAPAELENMVGIETYGVIAESEGHIREQAILHYLDDHINYAVTGAILEESYNWVPMPLLLRTMPDILTAIREEYLANNAIDDIPNIDSVQLYRACLEITRGWLLRSWPESADGKVA